MLPQDLIAKKRDGEILSEEDIRYFVKGLVSGEFKKYQASALLMAIVLRGMNKEETGALTRAMIASGDVVDTSRLQRPRVDKHSTGGVGDKVSLVLAPLVAACGLAVPMISGRGLGHTGGTLDKLESIPGFRTDLSLKACRKQLEKIQVCLMGQTDSLVPADRMLYALRDVTGTVESIPLIAASIMSKKVAEGLDGLVLDVKAGSGAFMKTRAQARELAQWLVSTGGLMGVKTRALVTSMEEPLGHCVGNTVEVEESIACLRGEGPADLMSLVMDLGGEMLLVGGVHQRLRDAKEALREAIADGSALKVFEQVVKAQGGNPRVVDDFSLLPQARHLIPVFWEGESGIIHEVDAMGVGRIALEMGAGRKTTQSKIDLAVGLSGLVKCGQRLEEGAVIGVLHVAKKGGKTKAWADALRHTVTVRAEPWKKQPQVLERMGPR